jgi:hypothetical protein
MTLSVEQHPCWSVACDRCGEGDNVEYGGAYHYASEAEARAAAVDYDWVLTDDGRALCPDCFETLRGEISCPDGAGCAGGGCGSCPTDEQVFARLRDGGHA